MIGSLMLAALLAQAPAKMVPQVAPVPAQAPARPQARGRTQQEELRRTLELRRARRTRGTMNREQFFAQQKAQMQAANPPVDAQLQAQNQALMQQNQALQSLADAAQRRAAVSESQFRLNSQLAGVPQVFVPGQGMVPYAYGIATPYNMAQPGTPVVPGGYPAAVGVQAGR